MSFSLFLPPCLPPPHPSRSCSLSRSLSAPSSSLSLSRSLSLSLSEADFNCDQNAESATKEEKKRFPRESTAHCKNPQGGKIFGSFNTTSGPKYAHSNSQWEIYSCSWKLQRSGFTACRPCKLCPISQNMPAPKRALDMKYTNHILCASQHKQAVLGDPRVLWESYGVLLSA